MQRNWSLRKKLVQDVAQAALQHFLATEQNTFAYSDLAGDAVSIINSRSRHGRCSGTSLTPTPFP
jgi:hypothetical protein